MNIHEFQARQLLERAGIPVPRAEVATTPDEAREVIEVSRSILERRPSDVTLQETRSKAAVKR